MDERSNHIEYEGLRLWDDLSDDEKKDQTLIRRQTELHETALEKITDTEEHERIRSSYDNFINQWSVISKELRKRLDAKKKELQEIEQSEESSKLKEYYKSFLKEHEIYYVANEHIYMEYFPDTGEWEQMRPEALRSHYSILSYTKIYAFDDAMNELGRKKVSTTSSFFPQSDRVLNLMRRDHWLHPVEGEPHYAFELLLKALGNNSQENIDHIEQLVYWKYTYPEEYKLPCLIIYGEGGVGKNTFVKEVLGTIFGNKQVLVADAEKVLGNFTGLIQGKTVVMIDEAIAEKTDADRLKRTVGNRTIDINPKYGKQGEHDNTPWYLAGGNDRSGAVLLAGDATDRRWSIIKVDKTIIQRLADDRGIDKESAIQEYRKLAPLYTNREAVERWLHYLVQKWSQLEHPPVGLHTEDYSELLETQKSPFDELMEMVFIHDKHFEYVTGPQLYELYKAFSKVTNPAARGGFKRNTFYANVRNWLKKNTSHIAWDKIKISNPLTKKLTSADGAYLEERGKTFQENVGKYSCDPESTPFWEKVYEEDPLVVVDGDIPDKVGKKRESPKKKRISL